MANLTLPKNIKDKNKFEQYMNLMKLNDKVLTTVNQQSLVNALATIWDLNLNNTQVRKEIALIPYGNELQVQIQEDGFLKLLRNNIKVINFQREIITDKHIFNIKTNRWEINPSQIFQPKKVIGCYGSITVENELGNIINFYKGMTIQECLEWKTKFSKSPNGPWVKSFNQMALKTVIKAIIRDIFKDPTLTMKNQIIMDKAMQLDQAVVIDSDTISYSDNPNSNNESIKLNNNEEDGFENAQEIINEYKEQENTEITQEHINNIKTKKLTKKDVNNFVNPTYSVPSFQDMQAEIDELELDEND